MEMQYSTNSTNGIDGTWTNASTTNTPVEFTAGDVYIREKAITTNFRKVATIEPAVAAPTGIVINVALGQITGTTATQEYSLDNGATWNNASAGNTAVTFVAGNSFVVREKATDSTLASASTTPITVAPATAPVATIAQGTDDGTIKLTGLTSDADYEYIVDSNPSLDVSDIAWLSATVVTGPVIDNMTLVENQYVHLRVKATATTLASEAQNIQVGSDDIRSYAKDVAAIKADLTVQFPIADSGSFQNVILEKNGATLTWNQISGAATASVNPVSGSLTIAGTTGQSATFSVTITKGAVNDTKEITVTVK